MPDQIAMIVKGAKQGIFAGEPGEPAAGAGSIVVVGFTFGVTKPVDAATGMATGKRRYDPVTFTKQIDASSPLFLTALVTNEDITQVDLQFFTTNSAGQTVLRYRILLENAHIVSQRQFVGVSVPGVLGGGDSSALFEEIAFRFGKITMTSGNKTAIDAAGVNA